MRFFAYQNAREEEDQDHHQKAAHFPERDVELCAMGQSIHHPERHTARKDQQR